MGIHDRTLARLKDGIAAGLVLETRDAPDLAELQKAFGEFADVAKGLKSKVDTLEADLATERKARELAETRAARPGAGATRQSPALPGSDGRQLRMLDQETRAALLGYLRTGQLEERTASLSGSSGPDGGFTVPTVLDSAIRDILISISPVRSIARVVSIGNGGDFALPIGRRGATSRWVAEDAARPQTDTPLLGLVRPPGGELESYAELTQWLIDDSAFNIEDWLVRNLLDEHALREGAAFISGDGVDKPRGFLAGSAPVTTADASRGFGVLQYVASGQAAAMPTSMDTLIDLAYSLTAPYRANARWMMNSNTAKVVAKYKTTDDQYLWQPSVVAGQPDRFLGYPVVIAEDMPDVAAGSFPVAFGDFSRGYIIVDKVGTRMVRDVYTKPGFVRLYCYRRTGGALADSNAIKLLKIASS